MPYARMCPVCGISNGVTNVVCAHCGVQAKVVLRFASDLEVRAEILGSASDARADVQQRLRPVGFTMKSIDCPGARCCDQTLIVFRWNRVSEDYMARKRTN